MPRKARATIRKQIETIAAKPVMYLPLMPYIPGVRYDRFSTGTGAAELDIAGMPGADPKDAYEIENIMGAWAICGRRGELTRFAARYMTHPELKTELHIASQGPEASPAITGIEAICQRFAGMEARFINHRYSMHIPTTPVVEIAADGQTACGTWYDHSATCLASGNEPRFNFMVFVARYKHEFVRLDGKWYVGKFYWEPLIHLQEWTVDEAHVQGWITRQDDRNFPMPMELLEVASEEQKE